MYVQFNGQTFSDLSEKLSFNPHFFGQNCKNMIFLRKMGLSEGFVKFKCSW